MTANASKTFEKVDRNNFKNKHLIGIEELSIDEINIILDLADYYAERIDERDFKPNILANQIVLTLFFENSTRTRTSFEVAAKRLGADVVNMDMQTSSLSKGESFLDTIQTLNSMLHPDSIIVRHSEYGAPKFVSSIVNCPVINAGDSWHEHPTQALLDALTIRRHLGNIKDKTIAICGDIAHSRVAASNMILLKKLGANVHIIAPPALMPEKFPAPYIQSFESMEEGLKGCDVIMMLRNQMERMKSGLIASEEDFFEQYGLTHEKLKHANPNAYVMHPGPINRGVEISDAVADDKDRSLILEQVRNGVPTRMAVMDILMKDRS